MPFSAIFWSDDGSVLLGALCSSTNYFFSIFRKNSTCLIWLTDSQTLQGSDVKSVYLKNSVESKSRYQKECTTSGRAWPQMIHPFKMFFRIWRSAHHIVVQGLLAQNTCVLPYIGTTDMHNPITNGVVFSGAKMEKPSCFDNVKRGFMMGCFIGISAGVLLGGFSGLRHGLRGRELIGQVGQAMVQSGGTFGTFMSLGMAIRC